MNQFEEASAITGGPAVEKLLQWKVSLTEKLQTLKALNNEILVLVDNDAVEDEIEQADMFSERLQQSIINVEQLIASKSLTGTATHRSTSTPSTSDAADTTVPSIPRVSDANCELNYPSLCRKHLMVTSQNGKRSGVLLNHLSISTQPYLQLTSLHTLTPCWRAWQ